MSRPLGITIGMTSTVRITNSILQRTTLAGIQHNLREIQRAADRVASGSRIGAASDDPGVAGTVLRTDSQLRALGQYQRNISSARTRLELEETVLDQLTDLLSRAREISMREGSANATPETRRAALAEVGQLRDMVVTLGNTRLGGLYLFGGLEADQAPLSSDSGGSIQIERVSGGADQIEVGASQIVRANHNAAEIFEDTGLIDSIEALYTALEGGEADAVAEAGRSASEALDEVQALIGDLGARMVRLDIAEANIDALEINLQTFRSDLTEVEFEEAITELIGRQTALQAALVATSRILHTTLTDYLR